MRKWTFSKGHGTENDFVIILDRHAMCEISAEDVRYLCHRHAGVGADGLLRIVKARAIPEWDGDPDLWFMDYRNQDGSVAEMCGNGLRVFVRYLVERNLIVGQEFDIATRVGVHQAWLEKDGQITVSMGKVSLVPTAVDISLAGQTYPAQVVDVGNPHAVCQLADESAVQELDLYRGPTWHPAEVFPEGTNVEFIAEREPGQLVMRVYERGVGETRSCGTGVVAAAAAYLGGANGECLVQVPGGCLQVKLFDGQAWLTGDAVIIGDGHVFLPEREQD